MTDAFEELRPNILIADDDPSIVKFLADRCAKLGFEVQTASNGLRALAMARRRAPDILIVDVNMPEVDGLTLCARLLAPGEKPLEVVVITGKSHSETIARCEAFGATYACKGADLWRIIQTTLTESFPEIAPRIVELESLTNSIEVRKQPRILVVDDDPDVGLFLCSRLRKCGVDPLLASDGVAGYRIARNERPTIIISDCYMPNGDARYLLWRLRSTPTTDNIPVFIISGRRLDEATEANLRREVCGRPGAAEVFKKPLDIEQIFKALQKFCAFQ